MIRGNFGLFHEYTLLAMISRLYGDSGKSSISALSSSSEAEPCHVGRPGKEIAVVWICCWGMLVSPAALEEFLSFSQKIRHFSYVVSIPVCWDGGGLEACAGGITKHPLQPMKSLQSELVVQHLTSDVCLKTDISLKHFSLSESPVTRMISETTVFTKPWMSDSVAQSKLEASFACHIAVVWSASRAEFERMQNSRIPPNTVAFLWFSLSDDALSDPQHKRWNPVRFDRVQSDTCTHWVLFCWGKD